MNQKKIPMRTCVVTKEHCPKMDLIRVVRSPEGTIFVDGDEKMKSNGRGAYLKRDLAVILKAEKTKILDNYLQTQIPTEIYEELKSRVRK